MTRLTVLVLSLALAFSAAPADARKKRKDLETIESLEGKTVEVRPGKAIANSSSLARDNYREFLDLVSDDPVLRAEAMRRLGDLELEATEAAQLGENIDALAADSYDSAVGLYQQLLEAYPDYRRNDTVLYQLARAYEIGGLTDDALTTLDELVARRVVDSCGVVDGGVASGSDGSGGRRGRRAGGGRGGRSARHRAGRSGRRGSRDRAGWRERWRFAGAARPRESRHDRPGRCRSRGGALG